MSFIDLIIVLMKKAPVGRVRTLLGTDGPVFEIEYPNGYSASVIDDGHGRQNGRLEIAVVYQDDIVYDTPVTDDVCAHLTVSEAVKVCRQIAALPSR